MKEEKQERERFDYKSQKIIDVSCKHKHKKILKSYRTLHPFGKKSKSRIGYKPRKCTEICEDCGEKLEVWHPC